MWQKTLPKNAKMHYLKKVFPIFRSYLIFLNKHDLVWFLKLFISLYWLKFIDVLVAWPYFQKLGFFESAQGALCNFRWKFDADRIKFKLSANF